MNIFLAFFPIGNIAEFDSKSYTSWFEIFGTMNIAVYLSFFGNILFANALNDKLNKNNLGIIESIGEVLTKFSKYSANNLLMMFIVFACFNVWMYCSVIYPAVFMVLLIPVVVYLVYWSFSIYVFTFKDMNLYQSMIYSYNLVSGRWAKVFSNIIALILLSFLTVMLGGLPYSYLHNTIFMKIIFTNFISVITSYFVVAFIVFYVNYDDTKI
jgi:hypothetical protein